MDANGEVAQVDFWDVFILVAIACITVYLLVRRRSSSRIVGHQSTAKSGPVVNHDACISDAATSRVLKAAQRKPKLVDRIKAIESPRVAVLFFGSQTGTAQDLCSRFAQTLDTYGVTSLVLDLHDFDATELKDLAAYASALRDVGGSSLLAGFFLSTYGEGEPTDSSVSLHQFIGSPTPTQKVPTDAPDAGCLKGLNYIMFGLGNSSYDHFNAMARMCDERFSKWGGALRVGERGEGDDNGSMEDDYKAWSTSILPVICQYFNIRDIPKAEDRVHTPLYKLVYHSTHDASKVFQGELSIEGTRRWKQGDKVIGDNVNVDVTKYVEVKEGQRPRPHDVKYPYYAPIVMAKSLFSDTVYDEFKCAPDFNDVKRPAYIQDKLTPSDNPQSIKIRRECLHLELDITGSGVRYETGDHVGVFACNPTHVVSQLSAILSLTETDLDQIISLSPNEKNKSLNARIQFPQPCSIRTALTQYLDLRATLRPPHFDILAKYTQDESEKQLLLDMKDKYKEEVEMKQLTLIMALTRFKSVKVPLAVVLGELLQPIQVRYYSISSGSKEQPNRVAITAVVVRYILNDQIREGLCTSMLSSLHHAFQTSTPPCHTLTIPNHIPIYIRRSNFKLPRNARLPVVMVGPGTGVAPFRGFIHDRVQLARKGMIVGPTWLFYGSRRKDQDFMYENEWYEYQELIKSWSMNSDDGDVLNATERPFELNIVTAFSRETKEKIYVQHRLKENGKRVWELISKERGYFYVCGDGKNMARDVYETMIAIAEEHGEMTCQTAEKWVKRLKGDGRWLEDVWS